MKKFLAMLLALIMVFAFVACGEEEAPEATEAAAEATEAAAEATEAAAEATEAAAEEITGEIYKAENVQALAPAGWKAFGHADIFSDVEGAMDPDAVSICKGGETDMDLFSKPYIRFDYYGADSELWEPSKDYYDSAEDIQPLTTGEHTWTGFIAESAGTKTAILWTEKEGDHQYQASIILEGYAGDKISLEDADVLAILASVAPTA